MYVDDSSSKSCFNPSFSVIVEKCRAEEVVEKSGLQRRRSGLYIFITVQRRRRNRSAEFTVNEKPQSLIPPLSVRIHNQVDQRIYQALTNIKVLCRKSVSMTIKHFKLPSGKAFVSRRESGFLSESRVRKASWICAIHGRIKGELYFFLLHLSLRPTYATASRSAHFFVSQSGSDSTIAAHPKMLSRYTLNGRRKCALNLALMLGVRRPSAPSTASALAQAMWSRGILSEAVQNRLAFLQKRRDEIMKEMASSGRTPPSLAKELALMSNAVELYDRRVELQEEQQSVKELLAESDGDADMEQECEREIERIKAQMKDLDENIVDAVLPKETDDYGSDAIVEIKAGTGGDEATLFAFEIFDAYEKIARALGFRVEKLHVSKSEIGGVKEAAMLVTGGASYQISESSEAFGPYGTFKFESGVHRVQRIPVTDGTKLQTSAASVCVLPSLDDNDDTGELLPLSELKIETMRASGAGGQHVNTTDSAVRVTHIPTGITASIQDERSQHKNKAKALKLIAARVRDAERSKTERERGDARSALMGGGDRSERIRTYNYPQDRVTDHRCKESLHGIAPLLGAKTQDGNLVTGFLPFLLNLQREELLTKLEEHHQKV